MSGPLAEEAPALVFTRIGQRAYFGHDPQFWPLRLDCGVLDNGDAWTVIACGQNGCGAHLMELDQSQVRSGDWPLSIADMLTMVREHATDCEAFRCGG